VNKVRVALLGITGCLLGLAAAELAILATQTVAVTTPEYEFGQDHRFYVDVARRWLETGVFYLPHQTVGPYSVTLMSDVLYPPTALLLFVPFTLLPWPVWWLIPLGTLGYVLASLRPALWSWPLLAAIVLWPRTLGAIVYGNTDLWIAAAVAAGIKLGWPLALIALKPTFLPLLLVLGRDRRTWFALLVVALAGLPFLRLWPDYVLAMQNLRIGWDYSLASLPLVCLSLVAWVARSRHPLADRIGAVTVGSETKHGALGRPIRASGVRARP
jgi:hypothetical protein